MGRVDIDAKFNELFNLPTETEWVEFKEAKKDFDFDKLGEYFCALSNEANLKGQEFGWLVLGVTDKPPRRIVGTQYKNDRSSLNALKQGIAEKTNNRLTFIEIHEIHRQESRIVLFQIPAALRGNPTSWNGHFFGRNGESNGALNLGELETIRSQNTLGDWSVKICEEAAITDLDSKAIHFARKQYKKKNPKKTEEIDEWDDATFLNKAKVCVQGKITTAALLLLGKDESEHFLSPAVARMSWILQDESGEKRDYQHFGPPLILSITRIYKKIQNLTYRYLPNDTLFPMEVTKYDTWVIRELLNNCIAHQDYMKSGRINLVEEPDSLLFTNLGHFLPGSVEEVLLKNAPPERYRNPFLAQAMVNLNMIDTIGSGIRKIFTIQCKRFFPMPDYDLSDQDRVEVRLYGKILDENYTRQLIEKAYIPLMDVVGLDKIQKKRPISGDEFKRLKALRLIEGRRPNLFVSAKIAAITGDKAGYIKNRGFDRAYYKRLIISYLEEFSAAKREDIEELLMNKISDVLTIKQKNNLVRNLLYKMKVEGSIKRIGSRRAAKWVLANLVKEKKN